MKKWLFIVVLFLTACAKNPNGVNTAPATTGDQQINPAIYNIDHLPQVQMNQIVHTGGGHGR